MNVLEALHYGAYAVGTNQISGGPDRLDSDRFEITANAEQSVDDRDLMAMLQTLFAERLRLAFHREAQPIEA